jgi:hypothetical protein
MIKVTPFILTVENEKFKNFLMQPFTIDVLYPVFGDKSVITLFEGWKGKDMLKWYKLTNNKKIVLEFYPNNTFTIKKIEGNVTYQLTFPKTINNFINDMDRFGVELYWTDWIDENFEPKDYMNKDEISKYYSDLLKRMDKSHEINF